ncbi:MAG TPA: GNAT family N-acetyltransferase [Candidatus Saccharimonadales bacterium]|nr:GNAT family N-acetyltransferase [Candidatus Saccharimonadales bacterium]
MSDKKPGNPIRRLALGMRDIHERHRGRHRPSGFGFTFADRIDYLDLEKWKAVTGGQTLWMRPEILRVIENHGPENVEPRYALIFNKDKPVAALAVQIVTVTGERLGKESGKENPKERDRFAGLLRRAVRERILVAGNLISWGFHGIAFAPGISQEELWPGVAEALYKIRRAERLVGQTDFVMIKDLTPEQTGLESLRRFSYRPLETEPNMVLTIDPAWKNYEDYLGALDAKYRRNSKDQAKKLAGAGCSIERLSDFDSHAGRLHELYLSVHDKASVRLVTLRETCIPELARAAKDDFRCSVIRKDNQLLGFVTTLRDGETAIAWYIGFDRSAAAEGLPLYFRLLHTTIQDAIGWGCKRLSLGRTALEPKAAMGAKPEAMSVWMRHRVPAMNYLLRGLLGAVPHAQPPERNPFKKTS